MDRAPVSFRNRTISFAIDNPEDSVQQALARGTFYESRLLRFHCDHIYGGSTVLDVGANVGNHSVYYSLVAASRVIPFEPNPRANRLLRQTVEWNPLPEIDLSHLEYGVGAEPGERFVETPDPGNLGASRLVAGGDVRVPVVRLDDLTFPGPISFIKIDVEGMEMDVLAGARSLIDEHRPAIGIEVDRENAGRFWAWVDEQRYHVVSAARHFRANTNYICIPKG